MKEKQKKPWNTKMDVNISMDTLNKFSCWYGLCMSGARFSMKSASKTPLNKSAKEEIEKLYKDGYGLKVLSNKLGISYSKIRTIFKLWGVEIRHGFDVVTEQVKEFRSSRVTGVLNPWSDPECRENINCNGIQGYYERSDGELVWLRSSWEYIYAKWLDAKNINWKFEVRQFVLSDGTSYRPDFFIYENNVLNHVVEVKGWNRERLYKVDLLRKEFNINVVVVDDIASYCEKCYTTELGIWKRERKLKK
jgi:hypothetical protein